MKRVDPAYREYRRIVTGIRKWNCADFAQNGHDFACLEFFLSYRSLGVEKRTFFSMVPQIAQRIQVSRRYKGCIGESEKALDL